MEAKKWIILTAFSDFIIQRIMSCQSFYVVILVTFVCEGSMQGSKVLRSLHTNISVRNVSVFYCSFPLFSCQIPRNLRHTKKSLLRLADVYRRLRSSARIDGRGILLQRLGSGKADNPIFMFEPWINDNQTLYYPTNAQYIICRYN